VRGFRTLFKYGVFCDFSPQTTRLAPAPNSAAKTAAAFPTTGSATVKMTVRTTATKMQNHAVRQNFLLARPRFQIPDATLYILDVSFFVKNTKKKYKFSSKNKIVRNIQICIWKNFPMKSIKK